MKNLQAVKLLKYHTLAKSKYAELGLPEDMPENISDSDFNSNSNSNSNERMIKCADLLKTFGINIILNK